MGTVRQNDAKEYEKQYLKSLSLWSGKQNTERATMGWKQCDVLFGY